MTKVVDENAKMVQVENLDSKVDNLESKVIQVMSNLTGLETNLSQKFTEMETEIIELIKVGYFIYRSSSFQLIS